MRFYLWVFALAAVLSACGTKTPSADSVKGTPGPAGPAGPQGPAGSNAPNTYVLKAADGSTLPGVSTGSNTLFFEAEGTVASYNFNNGAWGLMSEQIYYTTPDCTGTPYAMGTNAIANQSEVFAARGQRWKESGTVSVQHIVSGWTDAYNQCFQLGVGDSKVSNISAYTGAFPLVAPGPYTLVKQ